MKKIISTAEYTTRAVAKAQAKTTAKAGLVLILALMLAISMATVAVTTYAADTSDSQNSESSQEIDRTIKGDYYKQYCQTLFEQGKLKVRTSAETSSTSSSNSSTSSSNSTDISMTADKSSGSVVITGSKADITQAEFVINKTYNFNNAKVGRFSLDATAAKGQKVTLQFFLDGSSEPFCEKTLYKQRKKNCWDYSKDYSIDMESLGLTGKHTISFKVKDAEDLDDEIAFSINSFEFCESSVPTIYFNIDESEGSIAEMNASEDHSAECYGSMTIDVPTGYTSVETGEQLTGGTYELEYIRGRGNSTWGQNKNPYKIKLDKKSDILGMGKGKHWVLLANAYDKSLLRNKSTFWIGKQLGLDYTPDSEFVDVVMNGEYYGSYLLCDQVRIDKTSVDIDNLEDSPKATNLPEISGGYLLSMDGTSDDTHKSLSTTHGMDLTIESPEFDGYSNDEQVEYIKNYVQQTENALYSKNFKDSEGKSYQDYLDVNSTALYYWVQEFAMNGDAYLSGSTYLYKPRNGKLYYGPLWDFDLAWGDDDDEYTGTTGWSCRESTWISRLLQDPDFAGTVVDDWPKLKKALTELTKSGGQLDKYYDAISVSARYNNEKYQYIGMSDFFDEDSDMSYEQEVEQLKTWINKRMTWVDKNVESIKPIETTVTYKTYDGKVIKETKAYVGADLEDIPEAPARAGYTFTGWHYTTSMTFKEFLSQLGYSESEYKAELENTMSSSEAAKQIADLKKNGYHDEGTIRRSGTVYRNMVLTATYIEDSEVVTATSIDTLLDSYYDVFYDNDYSDGSGTIDIAYELEPAGVTDDTVTITSSNPDVIKVDYDSYDSDDEDSNDADPALRIVGAGDAKITFTAVGGASKTVKVHIYSEEEYDSLMDPMVSSIEIPSNVYLKEGENHKLGLTLDGEGGVIYDDVYFMSLNTDVAEVGPTGVVTAKSEGTAVVACEYFGQFSLCQVNVTGDGVKVGDIEDVDGLRYKVTAASDSSRTVQCLGAYSNDSKNYNIKKVTVPATVKIDGETYRVTRICKGAFKNCKKLTKATIGKKVDIIGSQAFMNDKSLRTVVIKTSSNPKIYKTSFQGISKKAKFYVPKKAKAYYKIVLKGKKVAVSL